MFLYRYKVVGFAFMMFLCAFNVTAQDKLSLTDCIDMAISQNLQIKQSELKAESIINTHDQIKRDRLPSVVGLFNPGYSVGRSIDPYTNSVVDNQIGTNNLGVKVDWVVFNGYQRKNSLEQSALNLSAGQLDVQASRNTIKIKVTQAYMQTLMAKELLNVAMKQAESTQLQLDRIAKQVKLNVVAESSLYNLQAQLANDEIQITTAKNDVRLAYMSLGQLMNWDRNKQYELETVETTENNINATGKSWQNIYQSALNTLPEIKAVDIRIEAAKKGLDIARGVRYPTLSLSGSLGTAYSSAAKRTLMGESFSETPTNAFVKVNDQAYQVMAMSQTMEQRSIGYFNQLGLNGVFSMGFSLRIPIFNSTQFSYRMRDAKIQRIAADNEKKQVHLALRQQTEEAFVSFENALDRLKTLEKQVEILNKALMAAEVKLNAGVANPLAYTLAKTNLDRVKASFVQTKYEYIFRSRIISFYEQGGLEQ